MTETQKLIRVLDHGENPAWKEIPRLLRRAGANKVLLGFMRRAGIRGRLRELEEKRYSRYMAQVVESAILLEGLDYAFFKFRKPVEHVSVDIDVLIDTGDVGEAVRRMVRAGYRVVVKEPYTVTLEKTSIPLDLYTHPAFAWIVYMDGRRLLECCVEEVELKPGVKARMLTKAAEVVAVASHAVYKEHIYLLSDYYVIREWLDSRALVLAEELGVKDSLRLSLYLNKLLDHGVLEAPIRIDALKVVRLLISKAVRDRVFRATSLNILKYMARRNFGEHLATRLTRSSY